MKTDLQILIADYYATTGHEIEDVYTLRPSVESFENLPKTANNEGDVRKAAGKYYIFDEGEWNELPNELLEGDFLTKEDFDQELENTFASDEEVLAAIARGKEKAHG